MQLPRFARPAAAFPARRQRGEGGLALIVVLFAVALVSIVVLAYFNLAMMNRNISFSSAGEARANIVALSALDYVKGDLISEIQYGSTLEIDPNGSKIPIYAPTTNTTMAPFRMTANLASPDYTLPPNLVKWSSGTVPQWTNTAAYGTTYGPIRGSTSSTTSPAINGHFLASSFWTKPVFGTNATFSSSATPQWVYMSKHGPLTPAIATSGNMSALNASASTNYVIGRYAFTVYDEGGLLDVAAAGYSPDTMASVPTDVGRKGSQGFADLTQLGLSTAQVDQLVGWRNSTSASNAAAYIGYLATNAPGTGFLTAATNDQAFLSRQDLISFWTSPTQMALATTAGTNALTYLTTFSREKNAPSWGPEHDAADPALATYWSGATNEPAYDNGSGTYPNATWRDPSGGISYAYHTQMDNAAQNNRFFPNVRVKTAFTRLSGKQAVAGEPLVKNRFDLSKLSWIQTGGTLPSGVSAQDVYNYFGLVANTDTAGHVVWTYNHTYADVASVPINNGIAADTDHIMTLDDVASLGTGTFTTAFPNAKAREPDFFELLQAGILRGSLGLLSGDPTQYNVNSNRNAYGGEFYRATGTNTYPIEESGVAYRPMTNSPNYPYPSYPVHAQPMYQIIQIGANIIDQYKSDNFPTEIILYGDHFYGIQNLPYLNSIGDAALRIAPGSISSSPDPQITGNTTQYQAYVHHWLDFGLWNPHQNAKYPPSSGPTDIRVSVMEGQEYPYAVGLGRAPGAGSGGTDYMGRIFEWPGTAISFPPGYTDGPAWIGLKLAPYTNFPEPTAINYTNSYTSDGSSINMNDPGGRVLTTLGWQRAGVYLGWSWSPDNPYKVPLNANYTNGGAAALGYPYKGWQTNGTTTAAPAVGERFAGVQTSSPFTIYLQYEDINHPGTWHTYQELHKVIYSNNTGGGDAWMETNDPGWAGWTGFYPTNATGGTSTLTIAQAVNATTTSKNSASLTWNGAYQTNADTTLVNMFDPRSDRMNLWQLQDNGSQPRANYAMMVSSTVDMVTQPSRGTAGGPHFQDPAGTGDLTVWGADAKTWVDNVNTTTSSLTDWDYRTGATPASSYYRDRDYIARVGDASGWTNVVLPADAPSTSVNASPLTTGAVMQRPLHLNRPFRSVGELGYVFRDDPWKTLNFISANSGDAALLDLFYIGSTNTGSPTAPPPDFIAGKMNLNSAAQNVLASGSTTLNSLPLQALISQSVREYDTPAGNTATMDTGITATADIKSLSTNIVYFFKTNGPYMNVADLPRVFPQATLTTQTVPKPLYTGLKNPSEALIRAVADSSGTRTWNLMIDVVAQSGKFNPNASNLNSFTVDGEKHYWLHVAIDRFTGEIVDEQLEPVWE